MKLSFNRALTMAALCAAPGLWGQTPQAPSTYSPLSGIQRPARGSVGNTGILNSSFRVSQLLDFSSSSNSNSSSTNFRSSEAVSGTFSYASALASRNDLQFRYNGGAIFSNQSYTNPKTGQGFNRNTNFHQLDVSDAIQFKRFGLVLGDTLDYSPDSFTFGGGIPGIGLGSFFGLGGLNPGIIPQQGLLLQGTTRFTNASVLQGSFQLSQRSTVTSAVSYGFVRYPDFSNFNSRQLVFSEGFDYRLTARMSVALNYDHSKFEYDHVPQRITVDFGSVAMSYQVNRSLSLQGYIGPQFIDSVNFPSRHNLGGGASAHYIRNHDTFIARYSHSVTSGSFSILGTQQDLFGVVGDRQISRDWSASLSAAFIHSTGLLGHQSFNNETFGVQTDRKFTRQVGGYLSYTYRHQNSSLNFLQNPNVLSGNSHVIGLGVNFTPRGIRLKR